MGERGWRKESDLGDIGLIIVCIKKGASKYGISVCVRMGWSGYLSGSLSESGWS